jgi:RND family efflux transporter MFP subunit
MHQFLVLIVTLATLLFAACSDSSKPALAPSPVLTVELVSAVREAWPEYLVASGEIAPWQEASIGTELTGIRLEEVLVNVGDAVAKGQLLARYSEEALRIDLAQLNASVAGAAANLEKAQADLRRADRLETTSAMSEQAILAYRTEAKAAAAQLAFAQAQRDAAALQLQYARVLAPDDGVISARTATVGAVNSMGTELFRLVRQNRLEWRAEIPAESLRRLQPGDSATVETLDGMQVKGLVRQVAPTADAATRNGIAYVDLPAGSGLLAGMYAAGRFTLAARAAMVLPESAIVMRDGNHYLMQVDAQNRVHEIKVATGRRQDDQLEILGDLDTSARFVKSGGAFLTDGDLVQLAPGESVAP